MKKIFIISFVSFFFALPMQSTRYLLQTGNNGDATWRAAETDEIVINLKTEGKSLGAWYNAVLPDDTENLSDKIEVWLAGGTYEIGTTLGTKKYVLIYGGFCWH